MIDPPWMPRTEEEYRQQLAEGAGPQPDEMVRLQMDLDAAEREIEFLKGEIERISDACDTAESVAQMAAHLSRRDENGVGSGRRGSRTVAD